MAGHSKFKNIMHRKGAQDKKRAKIFSRLGKEISVSVKARGPDSESNIRLRSAISAAKAVNMPKDNIDRAIKKGEGNDPDSNYEEVRYEGYGPGGVAVIVEVLTDNRNRTAAEVRAAFTKYGGNLGETGAVSFMFDRVGLIHYPENKGDMETVFEAALEAGAEDVESGVTGHDIFCLPDEFSEVRDALEGVLGAPEAARLEWRPHSTIDVNESEAETLLKMLDTLDDNDDVQRVAANFNISDDVMARLGV